MLDEFKNIKICTYLVSHIEYTITDDHKTIHIIFHSRAELIANDSHINTAIRSMHQSVMKRIKKITSEDYIIKTILKDDIKIFKC